MKFTRRMRWWWEREGAGVGQTKVVLGWRVMSLVCSGRWGGGVFGGS